MSSSILIAGGSGFIGSHLAEFLLAKGSNVTVIDNFVTGSPKNVEGLDKKFPGKFRLIEGDICHLPKFDCTFSQIYNLASPASPTEFTRIPIEILMTGSLGHKNLLDLATQQKARILFGSTSEVYGDALEHPQRETYFGNVNSFGERSCYDEAKRFGEALTYAYAKQFETDIRIIRIFNTYGPRMRPSDGRIIPNFFVQALKKMPLTIYGDGKQTRSFCYVTDLVEGLYSLMEGNYKSPVNIGNPIERTVLEMAEIINSLAKNGSGICFKPLPQDDTQKRKPDITLARQKLNWEPKVSLEQGLQKTEAYFKSLV
ncbi:MAG: UDP-glucuronic acid decarboxylase family protein [Pseudobdellovibrionaceae bacterium]